MLYVFLVNTGTLLTLDMSLTMESVQKLSIALEKDYQVHRDKQVLMISGGQSLDPKMRVGSYCAGTDTNPIFLFSKEAIEAANPPPSPGVEEADKLRLQVEGLKSMPPSMNAVVSRTQLALQFHDSAKEKLRVCEQLVHDQHLQQQGWMAVIANLEDITSAFRQRSEHFRQNMTEFLTERPVLQMRLSQFTDTLSLLEKVPLLPKLLPTSEEITLMQWISHQDQKSTLMQMGHQCQKAVDQFSDQILEGLDKDCAKCLDAAEKPSMKEIKGLGERLFGLGQLVANAKGILTNQAEMAQGLVQNQTRVTNINDSSVLPDLCVSHQRQLDVMLQKHLQLLEICRMCRVAKDELCKNLHVRLRWVMYIEQQISATHGKMVVYHENLKRLRKRLEIVRQVVTAPELYASSLVEILRRKAYNQQFIEWAGLISGESKTVHDEEISRRKSIASQLQHHFLSSLFPGMEVLPPVFVTNEVAPYEQTMPPITKDDITKLAQQVPELAHLLKVHHNLYYTTSVDGEVCVKPLALQESETQTTVPPAEEPLGHAAAATTAAAPAARETAPSDEDDDDIDIYTAGDESDNKEEKKEEETGKDAVDDFEEVAGELKGDDVYEAPEDGRLLSNESDISETVSSPTNLNEFLSFKPSMDNLCLTSFTNNEPFYSAISTPMEGNVPFLSTRQEDLQANHQDLEGKIESLRKKLGDMELTNSVLASKKTELEKKSQESSAHADKLLRDYEIEQERTRDLRNFLQLLNQTTLKHSNTFRLQLSEVKTDFQKVQADTIEVLKVHYNKLSEMFSVLMEKETVRLQEKFSSVESSHVEEKEHLERELSQSQDISKKLSSDLDALKLTLAEKEALLNDINKKYESTQKEKETLNEEMQRLEEACRKDLEDYSKKITELENSLLQKDKDIEVHKVESQNQLDAFSRESEEKLNRTTSALKMESEMEIQDMEEKLKQKDVEIDEMQRKMEKELADGLHRIENEKVEALASLKREIEREEGEKRETEIKKMQMEHVREFEELEKSRQMQLEDACSKLREEMKEEKEKELEEMREVLRKESSEKIIMLQNESESELDRVKKEYEDRVRALEMELAESKRYEATPVDLSTEVMEESIEMKGHVTDSDMLEKERQKHAEEIKELREMLEQQNKHVVEATRREYELKMERIRQSMKPSDMSKLSSAEKQVAFNEAISRIAAEKDMEIRRLKEREDVLLEEQSILQDKLEALLTNNADLGAEAQDLIKRSREAERNAKYELKEMEETVKGLQQTLSEVRSGSPAELLVSSEDGSLQMPEASSKLHALLSSKEQECISLKKQLQMHMRNTHIGSKSDKITVKDIGIGDLVLITFEESHQNFVVFTFEPTLYFVHSESLHAMGLKQDDAKTKREFTLAKIVDREYCQARKAQNRFRVPLGTKFYRVRVTAVDSKSMQPI